MVARANMGLMALVTDTGKAIALGFASCNLKPYQCQLLVLLIPYCTLNHAINYTNLSVYPAF